MERKLLSKTLLRPVRQFPTDPFTNLDPPDFPNDIPKPHRVGRSPNNEALKLWKGRSGSWVISEDVLCIPDKAYKYMHFKRAYLINKQKKTGMFFTLRLFRALIGGWMWEYVLNALTKDEFCLYVRTAECIFGRTFIFGTFDAVSIKYWSLPVTRIKTISFLFFFNCSYPAKSTISHGSIINNKKTILFFIPGLYLFVQVIATFSLDNSCMKYRHYLLIGWGK